MGFSLTWPKERVDVPRRGASRDSFQLADPNRHYPDIPVLHPPLDLAQESRVCLSEDSLRNPVGDRMEHRVVGSRDRASVSGVRRPSTAGVEGCQPV